MSPPHLRQVRSTSIIFNSLFFTAFMPAMMLLHYTRPELGVIVPWWSVLLLPMATTASVLVHTPRSIKYAAWGLALTLTLTLALELTLTLALALTLTLTLTLTPNP